MNVVQNLMGGGATQSLADRLQAAKCSITGQGLAKAVSKATTEEIIGPKRKHVDYLVQCTNEPNISIPQMADLLMDRSKHVNWVVVFKSLTTIHNVMNYGNERFTQYIASNNYSFNLSGFSDKTSQQGYDMSNFIRRYAKYINAKATSYREMAFDFCKIKRGKDDGVLRTLATDKLLKAMPVLQQQVDVLLEFDASPSDLTNSVINAAFMLLFRDLIRLFACYNDGIINTLEKYFDMNKKQCREALDVYKKFLARMDKVADFFKVAEKVGIDKGEIPDLTKAPASLLEALEQHLQALENRKGGRSAKVGGAVAGVNETGASSPTISANAAVTDELRRQAALEEEQQHLSRLEKQKGSNTHAQPSVVPVTNVTANNTTSDLLVRQRPAALSVSGLGFDAAPQPQKAPEQATTAESTPELLQMNKNSTFDSILAAYNQPVVRPTQPAMMGVGTIPFQPYMPTVVQPAPAATNPFMVGNVTPQSHVAPSWPPAFPASTPSVNEPVQPDNVTEAAAPLPESGETMQPGGLRPPTTNPFLSPSMDSLVTASTVTGHAPDPSLFSAVGPDPFGSMLQPTPIAGTPTQTQAAPAIPSSGSINYFNNNGGSLDQTLATLASSLSLAPTSAATSRPAWGATASSTGKSADPFGDL